MGAVLLAGIEIRDLATLVGECPEVGREVGDVLREVVRGGVARIGELIQFVDVRRDGAIAQSSTKELVVLQDQAPADAIGNTVHNYSIFGVC